eukprot:2527534-Rhodomonas_salina.1
MEPPLAYMPVAVPAPLAATSLSVKKLAEAAAATPVCETGPASHYQLEHKEFIVQAQLTEQPMFDNKLHKNEQVHVLPSINRCISQRWWSNSKEL